MKKLVRIILFVVSMAIVLSFLAACAYADSIVMDSFGSVKAGDIITMGYYEQDNNINNGSEPIEWIVLKKENDRAFLMSRYALDCRSYNIFKAGVSWETCSLRAWLNGSFYYTAFSNEEKNRILTTAVEFESDPAAGIKNSVKDKLYILSYNEAVTYWSKLSEVKNWSATDYAIANASAQGETVYSYPEFYWWLRTPGLRYAHTCSDRADCVRQDGPNNYGHSVEHVNGAVRPVMWIRTGQQMPGVPGNTGTGKLFCSSCGKQILAGSNYCMYCGAKVSSPDNLSGGWSAWSTTPVVASAGRSVESRIVISGYNMVHYGTQTSSPPYFRMFRSYSIKGDYDSFNARSTYGEKYYTKIVTSNQLETAKVYNEGSLIGGEYGGFQMGNGTAYKFEGSQYVWFIESPIMRTEYRYKDIF